jgi:general stress protein 26
MSVFLQEIISVNDFFIDMHIHLEITLTVFGGDLMTNLQQEILNLFSNRLTVELATIDGLQPRLRPMTLIFYKQNFFLATSLSDAKTKQIRENPFVEMLYMMRTQTNSGYIRLSGYMKMIMDQKLRKEVADHSGFVYDYWDNSEDPSFILFQMIPKEAHLMQPGDMKTQSIVWETIQ